MYVESTLHSLCSPAVLRAVLHAAHAGWWSRIVAAAKQQQQVHGIIRWRPPCQFITQLMVTLMTATNDTNRPVLIPTHPSKSPPKGASVAADIFSLVTFSEGSCCPVFCSGKLPVLPDNYSASSPSFSLSSASSALDWASCALTQRFISFTLTLTRSTSSQCADAKKVTYIKILL